MANTGITGPSGITRRELGRGALLTWASGLAQQITLGAASSVLTPSGNSAWRMDFPVLNQEINGYPLTYLDSAATTQRSLTVIDALSDFYRHDNANPGATLHLLARRANERYEAARRTVASFIKAASPDEIVWTRGTTEGINLVASAWARPILRPGDEVLLTVAEHTSNLLPWRLVAQQTGATVTYVDVDDEGRILLDDLDSKLSPKTRLLSFSHVSNVAGYVNPAQEICSRARSMGARVLIDAAQSAPHVSLDVQHLGCDFLVFSSHKMTGPMGIGVLWGRRELLEEMAPYQTGSNMAHQVDHEAQEYERAARKFGAGTPNVADAVGLGAAIDYLRGRELKVLQQHETRLTEYALKRLQEVPGLRLLGPKTAAQRIPVFSFVMEGQTPERILHHLDSRGIAIRAGDLAALPLLRHFGVTAAARASCYLYTDIADLDRLSAALHELAQRGVEEAT